MQIYIEIKSKIHPVPNKPSAYCYYSTKYIIKELSDFIKRLAKFNTKKLIIDIYRIEDECACVKVKGKKELVNQFKNYVICGTYCSNEYEYLVSKYKR